MTFIVYTKVPYSGTWVKVNNESSLTCCDAGDSEVDAARDLTEHAHVALPAFQVWLIRAERRGGGREVNEP